MNITHDSTIKIGIGIGDGAEDDNVKMNISQDSTIEIGICEY